MSVFVTPFARLPAEVTHLIFSDLSDKDLKNVFAATQVKNEANQWQVEKIRFVATVIFYERHAIAVFKYVDRLKGAFAKQIPTLVPIFRNCIPMPLYHPLDKPFQSIQEVEDHIYFVRTQLVDEMKNLRSLSPLFKMESGSNLEESINDEIYAEKAVKDILNYQNQQMIPGSLDHNGKEHIQNGLFERAFQTAMQIKKIDPEYNVSHLLSECSQGFAESLNISRAVSIIGYIQNQNWKDKAWKSVFLALLSEGKQELALKVVTKINDPIHKSSILHGFVTDLIKQENYEKASEIIEMIPNQSIKAVSLQELNRSRTED